MIFLQIIDRRPQLARVSDVLSIVFADQTVRRWRIGFGVLNSAGEADVVGQVSAPSKCLSIYIRSSGHNL